MTIVVGRDISKGGVQGGRSTSPRINAVQHPTAPVRPRAIDTVTFLVLLMEIFIYNYCLCIVENDGSYIAGVGKFWKDMED